MNGLIGIDAHLNDRLDFGYRVEDEIFFQSKPQCLHSGYMMPIITRVSPCNGEVTGNRR